MKILKHFVIYLTIFCIVTISIFTISSKKVYAEVPQSMTAIPHSASWGGYEFNYSFHKKYWTIQDPTGIPTSQLSAPNYFYKDSSNNTFVIFNGADIIQLVLTRGLSIVFNPEIAPGVIQAFFAAIGPPRVDAGTGLFVQGGVYDGQNNFLGYALNDISNCYYEGVQLPADTLMTIPGDTTNNVKNFIDYYNKHQYPDYINVQPPSLEWVIPRLNRGSSPDPTYDPIWRQFIEDNKTDIFNCDNFYTFAYLLDSLNSTNKHWVMYEFGGAVKLNDVHYIYSNSGDTNWKNFCEYFELYDGKNEFLASELYLNPTKITNQIGLAAKAYNNSDGQLLTSYTELNFNWTIENGQRKYYYTTSNTSVNSLTTQLGYAGTVNNHAAFFVSLGNPYTIYKSQAIYDAINTTQDYKPDALIGTNYYNYNTTNDNSITTTIGEIDNSVVNNTTIYEGSENVVVDNTSNGQIDQNQINVEVDIQIENVYPSLEPDNPSDPDNPSNPDNPSDPDDGVLDSILAALLRFFQAIGRIIGTVLAGIIEVVDAILESLAGIVEGLTGVTDFIAALFSWIPTPVPQVLGVGLSICILAAIIKFIRG